MEKNNVSLTCSKCGGQIDINPSEEIAECPYCKTKYGVSTLLEESDAVRIEKMKINNQQKIEQEKLKYEKEKNIKQEEKDEVTTFKKSTFSKVMILCAIFDALMCAVTFKNGKVLAGILAGVMTAMLIVSYLMKSHIIEEKKKGFGTILAIVAIVLFLPFFGLYNSGNQYNNAYQSAQSKQGNLDLSNVELKEQLPMPDKLYGRIATDRTDYLDIYISDITKQEFKDYVKKCINKGYTIDLENENWDSLYGAFDENGYNIRIYYTESSKEMNITLKAPEKMEEFDWPTNGLGTKVPQPKSNYGKISWDNSESFIVHVGNTTKTEYNDYVKECENQGYTLEHSKGEKTYSAKNAEGYKLSLMYLGGNRMEISVKPSEENKKETTNVTEQQKSEQEPEKTVEQPKTETTQSAENKSSSHTGLGKEFKEAMDSYEAFADEYIAFMKKYKNSNGTDMTILADYSKYISKLADMNDKFDKWKDEDLNAAEKAYYIEVQTRVNQKLLEF